MIDSVRMCQPYKPWSLTPPLGYNSAAYTQATGSYPGDTVHYTDTKTGYKASGSLVCLNYHTASLPRLLHGSNGRLLKNQDEIDRGLDALKSKASELGHGLTNDVHFTRVDLVWQFTGNTADFIRAHRETRHPQIRSLPVCYSPHSLAYEGSEMRIDIYDKATEQTKRSGNVIRVEIQLHGKKLKDLLGQGQHVSTLDFNACYQVYRSVLLQLQPFELPSSDSTGDFLAIGERENWRSGGLTAFELYTQGLCPKQIRRLRNAMAAARPRVHHIDWAQLLPAGGPPPAIDLP